MDTKSLPGVPLTECGNPIQGAKLEAKWEKAQLLNHLRVGQIWTYGQGRVQPVGKEPVFFPRFFLYDLIERADRDQSPQRELLVLGQHWYDVHCLPQGPGQGSLLAIDVTYVREHERQNQQRERAIYRDVIIAATQGRLHLITESAMGHLMQAGDWVMGDELHEPAQMSQVRQAVQAWLSSWVALPRAQMYGIVLAYTEAMANGFKHARQVSYQLRVDGDKVRFFVSDHGSGITLEELPKATLLDHYSTKDSHGSGFTIMLTKMDRLYLYTGGHGTVILLEKKIEIA
ncbi:ATP-binding protein [Heliophilum fasciatum]|uniref:Anti-sigma regulatory factor (Ser/Thr protein kinase) n=1 Tax=Heliophilum fasciatum TaxID=35700 RepID=A0A4R2RLD0_9FIRM|nr:ATP-binding protein [Heliophilum fasciatum]MCW2277776.1 anti-sigma regulatory factor (Ser/Thr protein kinase) [Heliophilum fasciatum]TCP64730.1 anti-sigma regulatory factor (Ser/Thr protein kinase) [Heliophilum fasciatum]